MDVFLVRLAFIAFVAITCYLIRPFGLPQNYDAGVGALIGVVIVVFEWRLRLMSLRRLIGSAIGSVLGIFGAYLFSLVIRNSLAESATRSFLQLMVMLLMAYVGLVVGANKGDLLNLSALGGIFGGEKLAEPPRRRNAQERRAGAQPRHDHPRILGPAAGHADAETAQTDEGCRQMIAAPGAGVLPLTALKLSIRGEMNG